MAIRKDSGASPILAISDVIRLSSPSTGWHGGGPIAQGTMVLAMTFDGFGTGSGRRAIIVAAGEGVDVARQAAEDAGVAIGATIGFAGLAAALAEVGHGDVLLVEAAGVATALLDDALPALHARALADRAQLIVAFTADQIDIVSLHLLGSRTELLCDPRPEERVAVIAIGNAGGRRLNDPEREAERERLRRLNAEVARIAETLARLARETEAPGGVQDRGGSFVAPPAAPAVPVGIAPAAVRGAIRARRLRDQFLEAALFADPAWDMLLDLFAARLEGDEVSVSSLCIAAAVPPTTALRWIGTLSDAGLVQRHDDPADRRRAFIALTPRAVNGMTGYGQAVAKAGLGWA
jgi:hypothetical protein